MHCKRNCGSGNVPLEEQFGLGEANRGERCVLRAQSPGRTSQDEDCYATLIARVVRGLLKRGSTMGVTQSQGGSLHSDGDEDTGEG
jgi:hypothetical protein